MCLSKAWYGAENSGEVVMENIAKIRTENNKVILHSLFGEERVEKARVEEVDFTRSYIILRRE